MNNNKNDNNKNDQNKNPGQNGTRQDDDKGKQAAPGKEQGETGTEKREAGTGTDKK